MLKFRFFFIILQAAFIVVQCKRQKPILDGVMNSSNKAIQKVVNQLKDHEVQILLTQVDSSSNSKLSFRSSSFQLDEENYFYPASTVKLPIVALALQKLRELNSLGVKISANTPFEIRDSNGNSIQLNDSTQEKGELTIAHLIKKIFLVSDNNAYNYLFDFLGRDYINYELKAKGLENTKIFHKFLLGSDNTTTWEYTFFDSSGEPLYQQNTISSKFKEHNQNLKEITKGEGFIENGILVPNPMDFKTKNRISLLDLEGILMRLIFPEIFSTNQQFGLKNEDYEFLHFWMSRSTLESSSPNYNNGEYWDSYGKFFIYGDQKGEMSDQIRIYNKVGYAYGTLTDVAYIHDEESDLKFFLTATVLVNENKIFNDDNYEYETVGIPFLARLGALVLDALKLDKASSANKTQGN
tara:strand:- start:273 stop:1502 length:1230 start_codon:yes stop_codon:yes gene_type:complete